MRDLDFLPSGVAIEKLSSLSFHPIYTMAVQRMCEVRTGRVPSLRCFATRHCLPQHKTAHEVTMKASVVNAFVEAAIYALEEAIGERPVIGPMSARSTLQTTEHNSIILPVEGTVTGCAVYGLPLPCATKLAAAFAHAPLAVHTPEATAVFAQFGDNIKSKALDLLSRSSKIISHMLVL